MARRHLIHAICQQFGEQSLVPLSWFSRSSADATMSSTRSLRRARRCRLAAR
jgi:hypothetical protein